MQAIKLAIVGAGNMASALVRGLLASQLLTTEQIRVSDVSASQLTKLRDAHAISTHLDNRSIGAWANVIILAVKPQAMPAVLLDLAATFDARKLFISIAAGVPIAQLASALPQGARIVRAMPNTPALVLAGVTALAPGEHATESDTELASKLFRAVGASVVLGESQLDAVTGLSGSGPAYVMLIAEALADGGVRMGLTREIALSLAVQTLHGSAKLLLETGEHPAVIKDRVASPGGTTISGLCQLEAHGLRNALIEAVCAAARRSSELGKS